MSKVFSSCTVDVLHIFGKAMCFFQNIGVVDAYNFTHTNVNYNPNFEKYLQGFISVLEELKTVLDKLYNERNKTLSKSCDYALSSDSTAPSYSVQNTSSNQNCTNLQTNNIPHNFSKLENSSVSQNYKKLEQSTQDFTELQNSNVAQNFTGLQASLVNQNFVKLDTSSVTQNYSNLRNSDTSQNFTELQSNSSEQNFLKLNTNSGPHSFTELHSRNSGAGKNFSELSDTGELHKFAKLHSINDSQNYSNFRGNLDVHSFSEYKSETNGQNRMQNFRKLPDDIITQSFPSFKNGEIKDNFTALQQDSSVVGRNLNELHVPNVSSDSQNFSNLQNRSNLLHNDTIKSQNNDENLLVNGTSIDNQIQIGANQLVRGHNDLNGITFTNSLITDSQSLVENNGYNIDQSNKITDNQYIDHHSSGLTPGSQLITSAIESLVQEASNHEDDDPLNSDEITFRSLGVVNQDNITNINCVTSNINESVWNKLQNAHNDDPKTESCDKKSYKCNVCNKILSRKSSLTHHSAIHTGVKPFCCEHCGKLFTTSSNLAAHLTRQHNLNTESANSCPECGKLFVRKSALETHLAGHRGDKRFSCYICGKKFTQKVTRDTHILTHTSTYPFSCNVCPKRFTSKSKLNFHKKNHGELQYSCSLCEKKFSTKQYLNAHYKTHNIAHAEAAPCCLDTVSENSRTQVIEVSQIPCPQCDLTFKTRRALTRHTKTKHNPLAPWYHCTVPDCTRPVKSFATRGQLHKHNKRHHSGLERTKYTCSTCGKEFAVKFNLLHHERQNHSAGLTLQQLKPFTCHLCPKRFTLKSKLNCHIRLHSQTNQFICDICAKTFSYKETLRKHKLREHSTLPSDQTRSASALNSVTCTRCGKIFKSKNSLMYHLQLHDGNFQYACPTCGKKFVRKCHYDEHVRTIHTTERPFKCSTCGRSFKNKKYWREHLRRVHTNEVTMQSLFDSITSEDALTTQHTFHVMHHVNQSQPLPPQSMQLPQVQTQANSCLPDVDVTGSFVLNSASFQFNASSSVQ